MRPRISLRGSVCPLISPSGVDNDDIEDNGNADKSARDNDADDNQVDNNRADDDDPDDNEADKNDAAGYNTENTDQDASWAYWLCLIISRACWKELRKRRKQEVSRTLALP